MCGYYTKYLSISTVCFLTHRKLYLYSTIRHMTNIVIAIIIIIINENFIDLCEIRKYFTNKKTSILVKVLVLFLFHLYYFSTLFTISNNCRYNIQQ